MNKKHKNKFGTGIYEERYDTRKKVGNKSSKEVRINAVDTKVIEALCVRLNCQPSDNMKVILNTWNNAD